MLHDRHIAKQAKLHISWQILLWKVIGVVRKFRVKYFRFFIAFLWLSFSERNRFRGYMRFLILKNKNYNFTFSLRAVAQCVSLVARFLTYRANQIVQNLKIKFQKFLFLIWAIFYNKNLNINFFEQYCTIKTWKLILY
jgi:hypothetical protein